MYFVILESLVKSQILYKFVVLYFDNFYKSLCCLFNLKLLDTNLVFGII